MCGPSDDYSEPDPIRICDFCKKIFDRTKLHELCKPLQPYGQYWYAMLCDACYKPYKACNCQHCHSAKPNIKYRERFKLSLCADCNEHQNHIFSGGY